jgi:hypothetical protein
VAVLNEILGLLHNKRKAAVHLEEEEVEEEEEEEKKKKKMMIMKCTKNPKNKTKVLEGNRIIH